MAKLSHKRKVILRKAVAALWLAEERANADDPMTDHMGASGMVADAYHDSVRRITRKAGYNDPDQLLRVAARNRLSGRYIVMPAEYISAREMPHWEES